MKRLFWILPLVAASVLAATFPIKDGKLSNNLDANHNAITNLSITTYPANIQALANGTVTNIGLGVLSQPDIPSLQDYIGLGGSTPPSTHTPTPNRVLTGYNAATGLFNDNTVDYTGLDNLPQLPGNAPSVMHKAVTAYNSSTGVFTQGQLGFSDLTGTVDGSQLPPLNQVPTPSGSVDLNNQKIVNVSAPINSGDAASKSYVDSEVAAGVPPPHPPVVVITTGNITLSGEQTINGVTTSGSRVLVANQTTATDNGIYVSSSGAWSRATDADTAGEIPGLIFVTGGTVNKNTGWALSNTLPVTLGSDNLQYVQVSAVPTFTPTSVTGQSYLSITDQLITANPVNLSNSNATGTLAAARFPALTGDVVTDAGSLSTKVSTGVITNADHANMPANTIKGNNSNSSGPPLDLSASRVKTILSLDSVENTALSTWGGSSNITSVGTINTGTWNANPVSVAKGGTGSTTSTGALDSLLPTGSPGQYFVKTNTGYIFQTQLPEVVAYNRITNQTTNTDIVDYTAPDNSSLEVSATFYLTSGSISTTIHCAYTLADDNSSQDIILPVTSGSGNVDTGGVITGGPVSTIPVHIRVLAGSELRIYTGAGTFTLAHYNAEGMVTQIQ